MTDNPVAQRLPSLTGLRFVATTLVFACHIAVITQFIDGSLGSFVASAFPLAGPYGVGLFFVLSGFVLTWTARKADRTTSFWRRRVVKIYPSHLVTFALAAALTVVAGRATGLLASIRQRVLIPWYGFRLDRFVPYGVRCVRRLSRRCAGSPIPGVRPFPARWDGCCWSGGCG
ncbi:acyltransferase [Micromonospora sp. ALFpr18c]|uniref:acyltransferase family protein n=1 Tax=Micromonospora sp. ALFpr18c TaxID=1458665 RepID=UPI00124BA9A5|nr:acyltransferase family protein [Micromonospora sp. ALFpr18c]KAB1929940.1 acyltransferase [Micromonospora sp. ALFpr18c]